MAWITLCEKKDFQIISANENIDLLSKKYEISLVFKLSTFFYINDNLIYWEKQLNRTTPWRLRRSNSFPSTFCW